MSEKRMNGPTLVFVITLISVLNFGNSCLAQQKEKRKIPSRQLPIEERDQGDSFIENLGELPGDIVTLPFKIVFKGLGFAARIIDHHRVLLRVSDWLTSEDEKTKVRPSFTPGSGGGFAFRRNDIFKRGMDFRGSAYFGVRTRRNLYAGLRDSQLLSSRFGLEAAGFYARLPDEDFFGIGNNAVAERETNYLYEERNFKFDLLSKIGRNRIAVGISYSNTDIKKGRDPNKPTLQDSVDTFFPEGIPGLTGAKMWSFQIKFYHHTRNETGHPTEGGETFIAYEFSDQIGGESFGYRKFTLDLRRYTNLFYKRVLALRFRAEITNRFQNGQIPFYRLAALGGQFGLRGYRPVRFRDRDAMLGGIEYRWQVHTWAIAYGFFEEGRVFSDMLEDFSFDDFRYTFGGGLRFRGQDGGLIAVLEIAKSKEQIRLNFGLNTEIGRF